MLFRNTIDQSENTLNLKLEAWVTPKKDLPQYKEIVNNFQRNLKQLLYELKSFIGYNEYIIETDLRLSGVKFNKKSYMKSYITLELSKENIDLTKS